MKIDFTHIFITGDRTMTNNGEFVTIIEVYPTFLECAVMDIYSEELLSEDVKTLTAKDFLSTVRYKGLKDNSTKC